MKDFIELFIPNSNGKSTLIDLEDWDLFRSRDWYIVENRSNDGYLVSKQNPPRYFHKKVMGVRFTNRKSIVNHINLKTLDNRKFNLEVVDRSIDTKCQRLIKSSNTSGVRGVYFNKRSGRWRAYTKDINGVPIHIGYFDDLKEATIAYDKIELKL